MGESQKDLNPVAFEYILAILATTEEAILYMTEQLAELRIEDAARLFQETMAAVAAVSRGAVPYVKAEAMSTVVVETVILQNVMHTVDGAYQETAALPHLEGLVAQQLLPTYRNWRREVEQALLSPWVS